MKGRGSTAIFDVVLEALTEKAQRVGDEEPLVQAYVAWLDPDPTSSAARLKPLAADASLKSGAQLTYRDVSVLGFARSGLPGDDECHARFSEGLRWMEGRRFFAPNRPLVFEVDGLGVLGLAAGILPLEGPDGTAARSWLLGIIEESLRLAPGGIWDRSLLGVAKCLLAGRGEDRPYDVEIEPDLLAALAGRGLIRIDENEETKAREAVLDLERWDDGVARAATQLFALRWLLRQAANALPTHASIQDLIVILKAVPAALRRWTWEEKPRTRSARVTAIKWDVQHEYHVQNLLWAVLAPIFPDLEDEEWLRSLGHKHPRCDLAIPSLRLIVEIKFVLNGTQEDFARVIEEVAADTSLYLTEPAVFSQIVAFVWDNSRSSEQHTELLQGLRRIPGITDAIIISRPGGWVAT